MSDFTPDTQAIVNALLKLKSVSDELAIPCPRVKLGREQYFSVKKEVEAFFTTRFENARGKVHVEPVSFGGEKEMKLFGVTIGNSYYG